MKREAESVPETLSVSRINWALENIQPNSKFLPTKHSLLKHKVLQLTLKISLYMVPTCFGPFGPSSGSIRRKLAKVTVCVEIISKNTSLKLLLCCGNTSSVCTAVCVLGAVRPHSTQYTHYRLKYILPLYSNNFKDVFLPIILQRL
jgi:hypothetical protein